LKYEGEANERKAYEPHGAIEEKFLSHCAIPLLHPLSAFERLSAVRKYLSFVKICIALASYLKTLKELRTSMKHPLHLTNGRSYLRQFFAISFQPNLRLAMIDLLC
jgi:hypothetical protein